MNHLANEIKAALKIVEESESSNVNAYLLEMHQIFSQTSMILNRKHLRTSSFQYQEMYCCLISNQAPYTNHAKTVCVVKVCGRNKTLLL